MGKNNKNSKKVKLTRNKIRLVVITAVVFFIIGFGFSYLVSSFNARKDLPDGTASPNDIERTQDTTLKDGENTGRTNDTGNKQSGGKNSKEDERDTSKVGENSHAQLPTNPTTPNVEKLNIDALEKLDNEKLSWWIRLNSENKPSTIPDDIRNLISKYDGVFQGDTSEKVVYLTFDEGYENGYTPKILDTLKENNVKTIFFVTGPYIEKNPDLVKRMLDEGHQVGSHTVNHPSLPDLSYEELENELLGLENKFYEKFGVGFKYMRPPSGEYSERVLAAAQQLGYKTVFWSFAYDDWYTDKIRGADYAYNKVMENLHNGAVLLLHAVSKDNADALDRIIKDIKAQGYEIKPFDL
ncbi:MAG: delta-lactam-biosynthetic de-N-acetylase [Firmicutes bacterium]|nr:delta-lactam-biosynthetic de-N-acetylase [Bacillota bacterium]